MCPSSPFSACVSDCFSKRERLQQISSESVWEIVSVLHCTALPFCLRQKGNAVQGNWSTHCELGTLGGMFPRVFGDEFGDKFGDEFGDKFSELPNLVIILVMNLVMNLVNCQIR